MSKPLPTFRHSSSGAVMTVHDLPVTVLRWTHHLKATMIRAVEARAITREALCERYGISEAEYRTWIVRYSLLGPRGLRAINVVEADLMAGGRT